VAFFCYYKTMLFNWIIIYFWLVVLCLSTMFFSITVICNLFLSAPYLPSSHRAVRQILAQIDLRGKKKIYDLGSGDGRIITQIARKYPQAECIGIELNPTAYLLAKINNWFLKNKVQYYYQNFFKVDLSSADVVITYLFPEPMAKLEEKFFQELKPGAIVISLAFKLKNKPPSEIFKDRSKNCLETIYLYRY
jgi:SAM-dependent methyltransferase